MTRSESPQVAKVLAKYIGVLLTIITAACSVVYAYGRLNEKVDATERGLKANWTADHDFQSEIRGRLTGLEKGQGEIAGELKQISEWCRKR